MDSVDTAADTSWQALLEQGRAGEALAYYRLQGDIEEDTLAALTTLAAVQTDLRAKAYDRALKTVTGHETRTPALLDWQHLETELAQLKTGADALERRDPETAMATIAELDHPLLNPELATLHGTYSILQDDTEAARAHFERAFELDPKHYRALTNLGNLSLEAGEIDAAIATYERALKLNDSFANAHHNLGVAYRRKGQVGKSVSALRKAQNVSQKQMREEARESLKGGMGQGWAKYGRYLLYAGLAFVLYLVLNARGII